MDLQTIHDLLKTAVRVCKASVRPFFKFQLEILEGGGIPSREATKNLIKYLTPIKNKLDALLQAKLAKLERLEELRAKSAKYAHLLDIIDYGDFAFNGDGTKPGHSPMQSGGTKLIDAMVALQDAKPEEMDSYIRRIKLWFITTALKDGTFKVTTVSGRDIKDSIFLTFEEAERKRKILWTAHFNDNFIRKDISVTAETFTMEWVNNKFDKHNL